MYYPYSENKGADQLRGYREADLRLCFRICKKPVFSRCGSYYVRDSFPLNNKKAILNFVRDLLVSTVPRKSLASDIFFVKQSSLFQEEQSRKNGHLILVLSNTAYEWLARNGLVSSLPWTKITLNLSRVCHIRTTKTAVGQLYLLISGIIYLYWIPDTKLIAEFSHIFFQSDQ